MPGGGFVPGGQPKTAHGGIRSARIKIMSDDTGNVLYGY
jgi:hypothetical protein